MSKPTSLYVHIPFCKNICTYCDFKKFIYNQKRVNEYFESLFLQFQPMQNIKFKTIYIGGGTPSSIDSENLEKLLCKLEKTLDLKYQEFCIECNVEDIDEEFLKLLVRHKINRLSIGVQTFNDKYILFSNRHHNKEMAIKNIYLASQYIENISIDMIYAFPCQTIKELKEDLNIALSLPIKHLSYYSLLIEENTVLWAKKYENVDDNLQAKMYKLIYNTLSKKGFARYEISNFSKGKKYQSHHNKVYWENKHYYAIGLASSGYVSNIRYVNQSNILKYNAHDFTYDNESKLTKKDIMFEEIMLKLRMDKGLNIQHFNGKFHTDFMVLYKEPVLLNEKLKLIEIKNGFIKATFKGSLLLNDVLTSFMLD